MGAALIKFGDVFRYNEQEYVYLAGFDSIIYAAKIFQNEDSKELNSLYLKHLKSGKIKNSVLFCFVELTTKDFKDRIAHLGNTENNDLSQFDIICPLNEKDAKEVLETIKTDKIAIPTKLKELVKDIEI